MTRSTQHTLFALTLLVALLTTFWLIGLIYRQATAPTADLLADYLAGIESRPGLFTFNYVNAGLITLFTVAMLAAYAAASWADEPLWAGITLAFVPIYGVLNLAVYLSQVFVVPGLLGWYRQPETVELARQLLALVLHEWPGSATGFLNSLAYAVLGVPSLILGVLLFRQDRRLRAGAALLAISGALSIVGLIGLGMSSARLQGMTTASGIVYLLALLGLAWAFGRGVGTGDP
jgi:hypothetical protein